jgi:hypothetical protein
MGRRGGDAPGGDSMTMVFKLAMEAQKTWRRLMGNEKLSLVITGGRFVDGELEAVA